MGRDIGAERLAIDREIEGKTLGSLFAEQVARLRDAPALVGSGRSRSWREYHEEVRAVALGLRALGVAPGSFGVILSRNRPEHLIADLGLVHAGGTPVSLYTTLSPEQIAYIAGHCEAKVAFVEDPAFLARMPKLDHVILLSGRA